MKDPALKMAVGDVLQELPAAGVAKVSIHIHSATLVCSCMGGVACPNLAAS